MFSRSESVATIGIETGTTPTPDIGLRGSDMKNSQIEYTPGSGYVEHWQGREILTALKRRIRLF
jgi:hypothetical protein